jgi:hypothetical protein
VTRKVVGVFVRFRARPSSGMKKHQNSFDFILNTIPVGHEMDHLFRVT